MVALSQFVFNLVWNDVLTLGEFEDVLLSVDNLDYSAWKNNADITSVNPTILINSLSGSFLLSEVTLEDIVTSVANLTSRH